MPVTFTEETISTGCPVTIIRTWTATDACGNMTSASQTITYDDTVDPIIMCPAQATVDCANGGTSDPVQTGFASATDNCDDDVDLTYVDGPVTGDCPASFTRTWTATDDCGNTCNQTIFIDDQNGPVITVPADVTVECDESTAPASTGTATATDDCSTVTVDFSDGPMTGSCPYQFVRTWTATDGCGNTSIATQTINIEDTVSPTVDAPAPGDMTIECSDAIPAVIDPTFSDNCDNVIDVAFSSVQNDLDCGYEIVRTWTATDDCDNEVVHTQIITVTDTTDPAFFSFPQDITVECDNLPAPSMPIATDNCDTDVMVTYIGEVVTGDACNGTVIRTWTATDDCGNMTTATQTITTVDNVDPVIVGTIPTDVDVECDMIPVAPMLTATDNCDDDVQVVMTEDITVDECPYTITRTWTATDDCGNTAVVTQSITVTDTEDPIILDYPLSIDAYCDELDELTIPYTDNCSDVTVTYSDIEFSGDCYGTLERTWTATDACGNSASSLQYIFLQDSINPTFVNIPSDVTILCTDPIPAVATDVLAIDNCDDSPEVTFSETNTGPNCPYIITRTWTAQDGCGNTTVVTQTITVVTNLQTDEVLMSAYPNPFGDDLTLTMALPADSYISFEVYNSAGQKVDVIFDGMAQGGVEYTFRVSTAEYNEGVYYARFIYEDDVHTEKIVKTK